MMNPRAQLFRFVGDMFSPAGARGRVIVLAYHRTCTQPDPVFDDAIEAATFTQHMSLLAETFNVLPLGEACARLARGTLPPRAACITFDDGYADNVSIALPILKRFGLPATFFVSTGYLDGGIMFNDGVIEAVRQAPAGMYDLSALGLGRHTVDDRSSRRMTVDALIGALKYLPVAERGSLMEQIAARMHATLPRNLMMTAAQVRRLHDEGMEIGGHTVSHPILASLDQHQARSEIVDGKRRLEAITGAPVTLFAYPNGKPGRDYGPQHAQLVRQAGFVAAVSTVGGVADRASDIFQLPRFNPWDRTSSRLGMRMLLSYSHASTAQPFASDVSRPCV